MPAGNKRSRSLKRLQRRVPSGRVRLAYAKRKPKQAHCAACGDLLKGVPRERPHKMRTMTKTKKRPERPFGGVLCSPCMRRCIIACAREEQE